MDGEMNELELYASGYQPKPPYEHGHISGVAIDREITEATDCPECGHKGMEYHPWSKPGSYRAFAVCPECHHSYEF